MKNEMIFRIYDLLQKSDLNWYGWRWWSAKDEWFEQFTPEEIDKVAEEMANHGMIESNKRGGYIRKEKTLKEKIYLKLWS